jgi:CPA2 family monovalent cation:H+ antiporter-2
LEAAGIQRATALLVTVPAFPDVRAIVTMANRLHAGLAIGARADGPDAVRALYALGVEEVTSPEFEAAIEMTGQALRRLNVPADEILAVASGIRQERYAR